jgi:hypothetical protein
MNNFVLLHPEKAIPYPLLNHLYGKETFSTKETA